MSESKSKNTVLVCRPKMQASNLLQKLASVGFTALPFALIDIVPDALAIAKLKQQAQNANWIIFVSPSALDLAYPHIKNSSAQFASIGKACAMRLQDKGAQNIVYPSSGNDSKKLLAEAKFNVKLGQRVLIIGGYDGRNDLSNALQAKGAQIEQAQIYRRVEIQANWQAFDAAKADKSLYAACVTSSQIAALLFKQASQSRRSTLQSLTYCVPHKRIADSLMQSGARDIMITELGDQAMVGSLCQRLKP